MPRQSAAVYRRRRLLLLIVGILVVVAVGVGVWLLVTQPWANAAAGPAPTSSASSAPSDSPDPSTTPSETPDADAADPTPAPEETPALVACAAKDVEVTAVTDADSYDAGVAPRLSISLTNRGSTDCTLDVGSTTQRFTVSSGSDVWWRSTDCQENPSSMIATLAAGATVTSKEPVTWDRTRSATDTCDQEMRQRAPGGGSSYHVEVSIGGFTSQTTKQILLY